MTGSDSSVLVVRNGTAALSVDKLMQNNLEGLQNARADGRERVRTVVPRMPWRAAVVLYQALHTSQDCQVGGGRASRRATKLSWREWCLR